MALRIALVYRYFMRTGSIPRTTVELARHLSRRHDVHVFSIDARTDRSLAPECTFHNVPVTAPLGDGISFVGRELLQFARGAARLVHVEEFDVVHACAPSTWVGDVLHVPGLVRGEARLANVSGARLALRTIRRPGLAARRAIEWRAMNGRTPVRVHVATPTVQADVIREYGFSDDRILVVPPAVNLSEFVPGDRIAARGALRLPSDSFIVLFVGNDFARKGLDRAIEGIRDAECEPLLLVAGSGDPKPFQSLARSLGVESRVRFVGAHPDPARFYHAADAVVLPTRHDVWGITPFEAMACGVPPIVSAAAGSSIAVRDGETGLVLPEPFEVSSLTEAIDRLAGDPERRGRIGRAGIAAAQSHSWAERGHRVEEDLIRVADLLGRRPPRRNLRQPLTAGHTDGGPARDSSNDRSSIRGTRR